MYHKAKELSVDNIDDASFSDHESEMLDIGNAESIDSSELPCLTGNFPWYIIMF